MRRAWARVRTCACVCHIDTASDTQPHVKSVSQGSVADASGAIRPGDTILSLNGQSVEGEEEARLKLRQATGAELRILILAAKEGPMKQVTAFWA